MDQSLLTQRSVSGVAAPNGQLQQINEHVPDLRWPTSTSVYDVMRKDGKCSSVLRALTMPARGTRWHVEDAPDVPPYVSQFVRNNLGLTEEGATRLRRRGQGISWDPFLRQALLSLPFGFIAFEPVFQLGGPGPNDPDLPPKNYLHLARLALIMPQTVTGFQVSQQGDLISITQSAQGDDGRMVDITLPSETILMLCNEREGGDWSGQSILRSAYKHWYIKDQLERLGVMIVERNGMGIPTAEFSDNMDRNQMQAALSAARSGDLSGIAMPAGSNFRLAGVEGSLADPMPQLAYHTQAIAQSMLAMFMDLGHDAGARSLGETFVDFFTMVVNASIRDLEETFTEHLSRRLVEMNFGPDMPYPEILADNITPQAPLTAETIAALVTAGALTVDPDLESFIRHTFGMPPATVAQGDEPPAATPDNGIEFQAGSAKMSGARWRARTLVERERDYLRSKMWHRR